MSKEKKNRPLGPKGNFINRAEKGHMFLQQNPDLNRRGTGVMLGGTPF